MKKILLVLAVLTPALAQAHTGQGAHLDLATGLLHPFSGIDHLLAMLAVGYWAKSQAARAAWIIPVAFVISMVVGAILPALGLSWLGVEQLIASTVLLMGLLILFAVRLPFWLGAGLVALCGVTHGFAHGTEIPLGGSLAWYGLGFTLSTVALHAAGWGVASFHPQKNAQTWARRVVGTLCVGVSMGLLFS